jgi:hypothetical protein
MRRTADDIAAAIALANLTLLQTWTELLTYTSADTYLMKTPPRPVEYYSAITAALLLTLLFWPLIHFARRAHGRAGVFAQSMFLLTLLLPANAIRAVLAKVFPLLKGPLFRLLGENRVYLLLMALGVVAFIIAAKYRNIIARSIIACLPVFSFFFPVVVVQAVGRIVRYDPTRFENQPTAPRLSVAAHTQPRVVWLIFDEMDQRLTFDARATDLQLPELDRFRSGSLYASKAYSPARDTLTSLPSLLRGSRARSVKRMGPDELILKFDDSRERTNWKGQPNIFSDARALGFNTAMIGWYHPYCRMINADVVSCWSEPMPFISNSKGDSFFELVLNQFRSLFETSLMSPFPQSLTAKAKLKAHREILGHALQAASDGSIGLTLIHFPVPHAPHIYNRRTGRLDLSNSPIEGYWDSLALVDQILRNLREAMQHSGVWDESAVLLSADHQYRSAKALDGHEDARIPFMLKLPGQQSPATLELAFNTIVTRDLLLAILRRDLSTPDQVKAWLLDRKLPDGDLTTQH